MIPWRQHARHCTSAARTAIAWCQRTAIAGRRERPRHRKSPVLLPRIARSMRATATWCQRTAPVLRSRIARAARGAVSRGRNARHRRRPDLLPRILITALAAIALAAGLVPGILAAQATPAAVITHSRVVTRAVHAAVISDKALIFQARARAAAQAAARAAAVLAAHTYTVRSGDSMSSVAERHCGPGRARDWTGIYAASRERRWTAANANVLTAGQHLYLSCAYLPSMLRYAPAPPPPPVIRTVTVSTGYRRIGRNAYHRAYHSAYHRAYRSSYSNSGTYSYAGLEALWISAGGPSWAAAHAASIAECESGGRVNAYNPSGATGLWQILGSVVGGSLYNPYANAANAVAKFRASGDTFAQWVCT